MELGGSEMILIFFIALVVLGPEELVKYAVKAGKTVAKLRTQFENFKTMTQEELLKRADASDLKDLSQLNKELKSFGDSIQGATLGIGSQMKNLSKSVEMGYPEASVVTAPSETLDELQIESRLLMMRNHKKS